jgi:hypothetical protein
MFVTDSSLVYFLGHATLARDQLSHMFYYICIHIREFKNYLEVGAVIVVPHMVCADIGYCLSSDTTYLVKAAKDDSFD